jgi:hypothetical protein
MAMASVAPFFAVVIHHGSGHHVRHCCRGSSIIAICALSLAMASRASSTSFLSSFRKDKVYETPPLQLHSPVRGGSFSERRCLRSCLTSRDVHLTSSPAKASQSEVIRWELCRVGFRYNGLTRVVQACVVRRNRPPEPTASRRVLFSSDSILVLDHRQPARKHGLGGCDEDFKDLSRCCFGFGRRGKSGHRPSLGVLAWNSTWSRFADHGERPRMSIKGSYFLLCRSRAS